MNMCEHGQSIKQQQQREDDGDGGLDGSNRQLSVL